MNDIKKNPFKASDGTIRLAFCGKMKSGKDTAANHLKALHGGTMIHMFASGYQFVAWLMLYPLFGCKIDPENKTKFERLMLQWVGHWGRVLFGKDVWLKKTLKLIAKTKGNVYVTGVRYPNEIKRLREIEVQSVWIDRPEADRLAAGAFNINHETETALDRFTGFDYKIPNDKDKTTFLRRVECYSHIDRILGELTDASLERQSRIRAGFPAIQEDQAFLDDRNRGWKPSEVKDVVGEAVADTERDLEDLFSERSQWLDNREIANEIERFAEIVRNELKVTNATEAVKSVRKTLHQILDNRPISGETKLTREEIFEEIKALAAQAGVSQVLVVNEGDEQKVRQALAVVRNPVALTPEEIEVAMVSKVYVDPELDRKAKVERAKRDRYNEARRIRRQEARDAVRYAIKRSKKPAKKAASKSRK